MFEKYFELPTEQNFGKATMKVENVRSCHDLTFSEICQLFRTLETYRRMFKVLATRNGIKFLLPIHLSSTATAQGFKFVKSFSFLEKLQKKLTSLSFEPHETRSTHVFQFK